MAYIQFDKAQLINLKYSLSKEFIRSNRAGSYASSTIINCNTRKYHGLLICPLKEFNYQNHLLLSGVDETIIQHEKEFHLAVRKYPGHFHPGHKYIRDFSSEPLPSITYRVGGVILKKEMLLAQEEEQVLIKYTLIDANSPTILKLHPFLAFRNIHSLSKANIDVKTKYAKAENGIKTKMYDAYPFLYIQTSKNTEYIHAPDWYYNLEYIEEQKRGYEFLEDLFVPGYFEFSLKKGESIIFSAGLNEAKTQTLKSKFTSEIKKRIPRDNFENCLINSAEQFFIHKNNKTEIAAGFPWFGPWGRDTFISLPGLTLAINKPEKAKAVLDTMSKQIKNGLFKNMGSHDDADTNSVDAPLWYFWAIQQYYLYTKNAELIWKDFGTKMKSILEAFVKGTSYNIKMHENGLIYSGIKGKALTWMDAIVNETPVTPRIGYDVEINALWYNAIMFSLEIAEQISDNKFIKTWENYPEKIKKSFIELFWSDKKEYLADYIDENETNWYIRPNQIFAASLPYSMLSQEQCLRVINKVEKNLLTSRGLRTLEPQNQNYKGTYEGNQETRDAAYHQGTVWPWLLGHFCEAYFKINGKSGLQFVKNLYFGFESEISNAGIGSISEIYDGDPPHEPRGAISQAWSVAELLRIKSMIEYFEKDKINN
ncbi:MAG: glycogen debranching enzyme family protein [Bacteroidales bacterium]|nr:glycogen debranching enzyme family protein [Bacteroidales bacterium]MBN2757861.1 glycogen debranching enzyme family protein [Bacteroidales bacterium]